MDKTSNLWVNYLEYLFLLLPPYSFSMGILNFTMLVVYSNFFKWKDPKAFDWKVSG